MACRRPWVTPTKAARAALRAAEVLAGYKDTKKNAIKRIRKLIERAPQAPQANTAARLWLQLATARREIRMT